MSALVQSSWVVLKPGNLDSLSFQQRSLEPLEDGKVRVLVHAVGLNFADVFAIKGLYEAAPKTAFVPGLEFSGRVVDSRAPQFSIGDKVMGVTRFGGYSTLVDQSPTYLSHLPSGWSFAEGAAFPVQAFTALYALQDLGAVEAGQTVLINSAAGGVGLMAFKICQKMGVRAIGTVSSESKRAWLEQQGFTDVIVRGKDLRPQLKTAIGTGRLDVVLDGVGGKVQKQCYEALSPRGRLVVFGSANFMTNRSHKNPLHLILRYLERPKFDPLYMISENKSILAFNLIWLWEEAALLTKLWQRLERLELGAPIVGKQFAFTEARDAVRFFQSGNSVGKVVLSVASKHL